VRRNLELALSIFAIVVVGAGLWMLLIRPQNNKATAAADRETAAVSRSQGLHNEIASLQELQRNATALQQRQKALELLFPQAPNLPKLTDALQLTADQAGVELVSIQPSPAAKAKPTDQVASIATQLEVRGGYFQVEDFINRLEELVRSAGETGVPARSLLLQSLDLRPASDDATSDASNTATVTQSGLLTARITLVAYQVVKDAQSGGGPTSTTTPTPAPATSGARNG
jgi:Tfp pilus assembly protein PilO